MMVALLFLPEVNIWSTILSIVQDIFVVWYTDSSSLVEEFVFLVTEGSFILFVYTYYGKW